MKIRKEEVKKKKMKKRKSSFDNAFLQKKRFAVVDIVIVLCLVFLVATLPGIAADPSVQKVSASEVTTTSEDDLILDIYGNANEDDTIDMRDTTHIKLIIFKKKPETELADANHDGKISMLDVGQTKLIILGREKELTLIDMADRTVTIDKPVGKIVLLNTNLYEQTRALDEEDRIVGIPTDYRDKESVKYPELADLPVVGSGDEPNYEAIVDLDPDVVIQYSSWPVLPDELQEILDPAGIKVLGLDFYMAEIFYEEVAMLGYILDTEEEAEEYINFLQYWTDRVDEVVEELEPEEKKTVYFEGAAKYLSYGGADYGCGVPGAVRAAGGRYIYDDFFEYFFEVDPEDLVDRNPEVIIKLTDVDNGGYTLTGTSELKEVRDELINRPELSLVTAVKNNEVYVINMDISGGERKIFAPVFMAKCLYPEKFEDLEPHDFLKEYLEEWLGIPYQGVYIYPYPPA